MFNRLLFAAVALGLVLGLVLPSGGLDKPPTVAAASKVPPIDTVLERKSDGHFYVDATVNGQIVRFLVDTGASGVVLTTRDARRIGLSFHEDDFEVIGRGASGDVYGAISKLDHIAIDQKRIHDITAAIAAEGLDVSLLGQTYLSRIGSVRIEGDRMTLR